MFLQNIRHHQPASFTPDNWSNRNDPQPRSNPRLARASSRLGVMGVRILAVAVALATLSEEMLCRHAVAAELKTGDRLVFLGDSITQSGEYVAQIEAFFLTQRPELSLTFLNRGLSSETISGTSEPDHDPRRPWAHDRFSRDVAAANPSVVFSCYGMNDGNYHPFDWPRFEKYQAQTRRLFDRVANEAKARELVLLTPPPFDGSRRTFSDPSATNYGYKFPYWNYGATLEAYTDWLNSLREERVTVVNVHDALVQFVERRRENEVSFTLAPDAVHPNASGHFLMALVVLRGIGEQFAPAIELSVDDSPTESHAEARPPTPAYANATGVVQFVSQLGERTNKAMRLPENMVSIPLPLPFDPAVDTKIRQLAEQFEVFSPPMLMWPDAEADEAYELTVDGQLMLVDRGDVFAAGISTLDLPEFPTNAVSKQLWSVIRERERLRYSLWRQEIERPVAPPITAAEAETRLEQLTKQIDELRQPMSLSIRLAPMKGGMKGPRAE